MLRAWRVVGGVDSSTGVELSLPMSKKFQRPALGRRSQRRRPTMERRKDDALAMDFQPSTLDLNQRERIEESNISTPDSSREQMQVGEKL